MPKSKVLVMTPSLCMESLQKAPVSSGQSCPESLHHVKSLHAICMCVYMYIEYGFRIYSTYHAVSVICEVCLWDPHRYCS